MELEVVWDGSHQNRNADLLSPLTAARAQPVRIEPWERGDQDMKALVRHGIQEKVYACLPGTKEQIFQRAGLPHLSVIQALWRLMRAGRVIGPGKIGCSKVGVYGHAQAGESV